MGSVRGKKFYEGVNDLKLTDSWSRQRVKKHRLVIIERSVLKACISAFAIAPMSVESEWVFYHLDTWSTNFAVDWLT